MARAKYDMQVCTDGDCQSLGAKSDIEKAKAKIAREVRKIERRALGGKVPTGKVEGRVVDRQSGKVEYEYTAKAGSSGGGGSAKKRSHHKKPPSPPPEYEPPEWED